MRLDATKILQLNRKGRMGILENTFQDNVVVEKLDKLISWSRSTSPWFFQFGTACCAIEMMAAAAPCGTMAFVLALNYQVRTDAIAPAILFTTLGSLASLTIVASW